MSSGIDDRPLAPLTTQAETPSVPKRASRPSRSRSRSRSKPSTTPTPKKDVNAPWVVIRASQDPKLHRVLLECTRCDCRMSFPDRSPLHKVESLMYGFRTDHQDCKDEDKPEKKPSQASPDAPRLPASRPS